MKQSGSAAHLVPHSASINTLNDAPRSVAGTLNRRDGGNRDASPATLSALSFPEIPTWLGTQRKRTSAPLEQIAVRSLLIDGTSQLCCEW